MEKKEMTKKELLLLQVESAMDVNTKALMLAVRHYTSVKDYDDAIAYIKGLGNDSYHNDYILDYYRRYADMTPEMLEKWVDYRAGKCGEPIATINGMPLNPEVSGISLRIGETNMTVYEHGVSIYCPNNEDYIYIPEGEVKYLLRAIETAKTILPGFK